MMINNFNEDDELISFKTPVKKRMNLTIEQKIEIAERYEKGETQKELAEIYKVGR